MWQTELVLSKQFSGLAALFYLALTLIALGSLWRIDSLIFTPILLIILSFQYIKSRRYREKVNGQLAIYCDLKQIYWQRQRWLIKYKPLLTSHFIVVNLKSLRGGKRQAKHQILFLLRDNVSREDWRALSYFLHQI